MTTYHFILGKNGARIKLSFPARNPVEALHKVVSFFNSLTIFDAFSGQEKDADTKDAGRTSYTELWGKPLFDQPKRSNPFAECPPLLEEEAEMMPTNIEQTQP